MISEKHFAIPQALFTTAFAMALVRAIALMLGTPAFGNGVLSVFGLHTGFALFFIGSGLLFRNTLNSTNRA